MAGAPSGGTVAAPIGGALGEGGLNEGGQGGAELAAPDAKRLLANIAADIDWSTEEGIGMVVNRDEQVFFATPYRIYQVNGDAVSEYLTDVEAIAAVGRNDGYEFGALAMDPMGSLYATFSGSIIHVTAPHRADLWRAEPGVEVMRLAAVGADDVLALEANGLWRVTGPSSITADVVHGHGQLVPVS